MKKILFSLALVACGSDPERPHSRPTVRKIGIDSQVPICRNCEIILISDQKYFCNSGDWYKLTDYVSELETFYCHL